MFVLRRHPDITSRNRCLHPEEFRNANSYAWARRRQSETQGASSRFRFPARRRTRDKRRATRIRSGDAVPNNKLGVRLAPLLVLTVRYQRRDTQSVGCRLESRRRPVARPPKVLRTLHHLRRPGSARSRKTLHLHRGRGRNRFVALTKEVADLQCRRLKLQAYEPFRHCMRRARFGSGVSISRWMRNRQQAALTLR